MNINVELCYAGNNKYQWRVTRVRTGQRFHITSDTEGVWCRSESSRIRDRAVVEFGADRERIRII